MMLIANYSLENNFDFVYDFFGVLHVIVMNQILMTMIMMHLNMQ